MKIIPLFVVATALVAGPLQAENPVPASAPAAASVVKNVSPDDAEKLLKVDPKIVVLDVRTAEEFSEGHIAGAKNLDFLSADFAAKVAALDASKTYLVHCGSGARSTKALSLLEGRKFTAIYHLNDGFKAWVKGGKPVEK